ncbi:MAG: 1-phosphofructokinase family hexose kinase [Candidatus Borkfalkiaceae bacterium]|nr:1-phosphofructokinase family hexose kinase [Christensenellaceae bacterium]
MILTVCPNPSIDCTVELQTLNVGKVNRIENKILTYSGKALNVAIGVSRLGGDVTATGFMFERDAAQFLQSLYSEGVKPDFVTTSGNVRINYKIIDNHSMMTEINDKGEAVPISKQKELIQKVKKLGENASIAVLSGSLPAGVDDGYYLELIKNLPKSTKIIVDCEGEKLKRALSAGVYMVKPNLAEMESVNNTVYETKENMVEGAKRLIDRGAQNVLLSLGRKGAILTDGKTHLYCKSATVAVNSTVGAGDSMISACAYKLEQNAPRDEILRCAVAAGTASITTPGTNLFYKDKYEEIYKRIFVEEIKV